MISILLALAICHLPRDATGKIERSRNSVAAFRKDNPCPSTGKTHGACKGWIVDHVLPLCAGGKDSPENMVWQEYKQSKEKDKVEVALCRWIDIECKGKR